MMAIYVVDHLAAIGASYLDHYYGSTVWASSIDLARLSMASQVDDVLGQLFFNTYDGFKRICTKLQTGQRYYASRCGFSLPPNLQDEVSFERLTKAWRREIEARFLVANRDN